MLYSIMLCYDLLWAVMLYYALLCSVVLCYSCLVPLDTHRFAVSLLPSLAQSAFCFDTFPSLTRFPFYVRPGLPESSFYHHKTLLFGYKRSLILDLILDLFLDLLFDAFWVRTVRPLLRSKKTSKLSCLYTYLLLFFNEIFVFYEVCLTTRCEKHVCYVSYSMQLLILLTYISVY